MHYANFSMECANTVRHDASMYVQVSRIAYAQHGIARAIDPLTMGALFDTEGFYFVCLYHFNRGTGVARILPYVVKHLV